MKDIHVQFNLSESIRTHQRKLTDGSWIDTNSSEVIDFLDIKHDSICMDDIAQGLSNACRFAGQIPRFYSVAEHSVLVYKYLKGNLEGLPIESFSSVLKSALMHDAPEAYLGDVTTPLKNLCPGFKIIESEFEGVIMEAFGLDTHFSHHMIKEADYALFEIERFAFRGGSECETRYRLPDGLKIRNLSPEEARAEFLTCVSELRIQKLSPDARSQSAR